MMKYYYSDGKEKFGPVSLEELIEKDLQPDSLIWHAGLDKWRLAKNFTELNFNDKPKVKIIIDANSPNNHGVNNDATVNKTEVKTITNLNILNISILIVLLIIVTLFYRTAFEYYYTLISDIYNKQGLINDNIFFKRHHMGFNLTYFAISSIIFLILGFKINKKLKAK